MHAAVASPIGRTLNEMLLSGSLPFAPSVGRALLAIADASATLSQRLRNASLDQALGRAHRRNACGDEVQKLDAEANRLFCSHLSATRVCIAIASEELDGPIVHEGRHCSCSVMLDPLDGSGNLNPGLGLGSIFAIHSDVRWPSKDHAFFRPGRELAAAGYALYGSRTTLVLASKERVLSFGLDESGSYILTEPDLSCPIAGAQYSVNEANQGDWDLATQSWLSERRKRTPDGKRASLRYSGALVADAHRILLEGGVFAYPGSTVQPQGKLRLLYEVNPMAFVFEAAGGAASVGRASPLDQVPASLHQRSPIVLGSKSDIDAYERSRLAVAARDSKIPNPIG